MKIPNFNKPIEIKYDNKTKMFTAFADHEMGKFVSESETEELARESVIDLVAEKIIKKMLKEFDEKKLCPHCNFAGPIPLRTQSIKICTNCNREIEWELKEDESPVIEGGRAKPIIN